MSRQRALDKDPCDTELTRAGAIGDCRHREALSRQIIYAAP